MRRYRPHPIVAHSSRGTQAFSLVGRSRPSKKRRDRQSPIADFYIGAHATVAGFTLLTRDEKRYRTYFPRLRIASP